MGSRPYLILDQHLSNLHVNKEQDIVLEVGTENRTVVSGIALHFTPEEVIGKSVLYLANLAPRKMRGIESQGMILMAENSDGKLYFMQPSANIDSVSGVS